MKSILLSFCFAILTSFGFSQESKIVTDTLAVAGVCGMCENRIESAASIGGVKKANWDKENQQLIVIYNSKKTTLVEIADAIQNAGHDTEKGMAAKGTYQQIDKCCRYREMEIH